MSVQCSKLLLAFGCAYNGGLCYIIMPSKKDQRALVYLKLNWAGTGRWSFLTAIDHTQFSIKYFTWWIFALAFASGMKWSGKCRASTLLVDGDTLWDESRTCLVIINYAGQPGTIFVRSSLNRQHQLVNVTLSPRPPAESLPHYILNNFANDKRQVVG